MPANTARFIKNLVWEIIDSSEASKDKTAQAGVMKTAQANTLYANIPLPQGYNHTIGTLASAETNEVFVFLFNENDDSLIYKLNGYDGTYDIVYNHQNRLNFRLSPENFLHEGAIVLKYFFITNPDNDEKIKRSFILYTDAKDRPRQIAVEDSIATNGFDENLFPYFQGNYDRKDLISMGLPTPKECITLTEIPRTPEDAGLSNNLLFNTWQFRIRDVDVWGRPSEHGIISDEYVAGINDCFSPNNIARCLKLTFDAGNPIIDKKQIEYRNCNSTQWYLHSVINLYDGSPLGEWWLRTRNPDLQYNPTNNTIDYIFCREKECDPISVTETNRLNNPLPHSSEGVAKFGEFVGLYNNKDGFTPLSQSVLDNITFEVTPPEKRNTIKGHTVTVYVTIYNQYTNASQGVIKDPDSSVGYVWGGVEFDPLFLTYKTDAKKYSQYFTNQNQSGFLGYLAGSGESAISTQVYVDNDGNLVDDPEHIAYTQSPKIILQKFVFNNVRAGVYLFRLASHLYDPVTQGDFENTSTTVWGLCPFNPSTFDTDVNGRSNSQELVIDMCDFSDDDYNTLNDNKILVIADLSFDKAQALSGYVYETRRNGFNEKPMELMAMYGNGYIDPHPLSTDHNGFYYSAVRVNNQDFSIHFMNKCFEQTFNVSTNSQSMTFRNYFIDELNGGAYSDYSIVACNRILVKGRMLLAGKNIGVPNFPITLTHGYKGITDSDGYFSIVAHDDVFNHGRAIQFVLSGSSCNYTFAGSCLGFYRGNVETCQYCSPFPREYQSGTFTLTYESERSLLSGGIYGVGVVGFDWLGRAMYVQPKDYINIPSIIQSQTIGASSLKVSIKPNAIFPENIRYLTFWITAETSIADYLDWIVDRAVFIDNTGNENTTSPTQIKIYYASLNEFNKQNNFNTTTSWNFIPQGANTAAIGDKVQFFLNGDGQFFTKAITGLVKYDSTGQYFLIDYTSDLKDLKSNALIRLVRPKICTGNEPYFEIPCSKIDIKNDGTPAITSLLLNVYDTYYLSRQIPVPIPINPVPAVESTTVTTTDAQGVLTAVTTTPVPQPTATVQNIFGFQFEHHSPSNFWGYRCWNVGRVNIKNQYETEKYHQHQVALSGALSSTGQLNFLNYFDDAQKFDFDVDMGEIVSMLPEMNYILVICTNACFVVGFNDNLARVNQDGTVSVLSASDRFGKPQSKSDFGCTLLDKNTIRKYKGLVQWLDSTNATVVQHDYQNATSLSENKCDSYIVPKVKDVMQWNLNNPQNKRYFVGVVNCGNYEYLLTDFKIRDNNFVNNRREYSIVQNDTIAFDIRTKILKGWWGFTAEYYASLEGELSNQQLFSFKNGLPYKHYTTKENRLYGTFFDQKVNRVLRIVMCLDPIKKKKYLSTSVYSHNRYFCDQIITESNQISRILKEWFTQNNYFWNAPFLCDLQTPVDKNIKDETGKNVLLDGNLLYGNWIDVRYIGDPEDDDKYTELQAVSIEVFPSEKSGTTT